MRSIETLDTRQHKSKSEVLLVKRAFITKKKHIEKHYNLGDKIGEGAYGGVKKGLHLKTKQEVAIKVIPKRNLDLESFRVEVESMRKLDHPHIIKLYEWYEDKKNVYLVLEMCTGGELLDRIQAEEFFNEKKAALYFKQLLSAVFYCHKMGIIHRDLKPDNLLLEDKSPDAKIKLIDFGLSKMIKKKEVSRKAVKMVSRVGTPFYIAPEVISGDYTELCDAWSCGVILYILLSGTVPFYGGDDNEILQKIIKLDYDYDVEAFDEVSDKAKHLIDSLLKLEDSRLSIQGALNHPWVKNLAETSKEANLTAKTINNLKSFTTSQKLKKAVLQYVATRVSHKEVGPLSEIFVSLDENCDGTLSFEEFRKGLKSIKEESEIEEILRTVDLDSDGVIDYTEFLAATMDEKKVLTEELLMEAFNQFDKDRNGTISAEELRDIIGNRGDTNLDAFTNMIKEIDTNGDGEIDFNEFIKMMYTFKENKHLYE